MQFTAGLIVGAVVGFGIACILAYKKINHTYLEGYNAAKESEQKEEVDVSIVIAKYHEGYEKGLSVARERIVEQLQDVSFERYGNEGFGGEIVVNFDDLIEIIRKGRVEDAE